LFHHRVDRLRAICLALPETTEKMAHGEPTWRVGGRMFATLDDHHHGADRTGRAREIRWRRHVSCGRDGRWIAQQRAQPLAELHETQCGDAARGCMTSIAQPTFRGSPSQAGIAVRG